MFFGRIGRIPYDPTIFTILVRSYDPDHDFDNHVWYTLTTPKARVPYSKFLATHSHIL